MTKFLVTITNPGGEYFLRGTVWTGAIERAQQFPTREAAEAGLAKARKFIKPAMYKLARVREVLAVELPGGCGAARYETTEATLVAAHKAGQVYWHHHRMLPGVDRIPVANLAGVARACGWHGADCEAWLAGFAGERKRSLALDEAIAELERPGGCGAARLGILWTAKSSNKKTGPMPVSTSAPETCPVCPFKGNGCYAESGPLGFLWRALGEHGPHASWQSGVARVTSTDWNGLCAHVSALPEGTLWRHNQAGDLPHDSGKIDRARLLALVKANRGRKGFTYTHHNVLQSLHNARIIQAATLAGFTINLSGNTLAHADALADAGVAPVVCVLPADVAGNVEIRTPKGRRVVVCPATYRDDVSCKTCGLCAVAGRGVMVGFPAHGARAKRAGVIASGNAVVSA